MEPYQVTLAVAVGLGIVEGAKQAIGIVQKSMNGKPTPKINGDPVVQWLAKINETLQDIREDTHDTKRGVTANGEQLDKVHDNVVWLKARSGVGDVRK